MGNISENWNYWKEKNIQLQRRKKSLFVRAGRKLFGYENVPRNYANKKVLSNGQTSQWIAEKLKSSQPFLVSRFGSVELANLCNYVECLVSGSKSGDDEKCNNDMHSLCFNAGFFPETKEAYERFCKYYLERIDEVDLLAIWKLDMEEFMIDQYMKQTSLTYLPYIEPYLEKNPWSEYLKGKKVLVIHPFEESIQKQYKKRELLFQDKRILPSFELLTLKAVQTIAGEKDDRFKDWFAALNYMKDEALKKDFDVAIIGCGAYGMVLGAELKKAGKQIIHMGGATQLLFGIKGKRWEQRGEFQKLFNDNWVYPSSSEIVKNSNKVEQGCYW